MAMILLGIWLIQIFTVHDLMVGWSMVFGEIVSAIKGSGCPVYIKVFLTHAIADPIVSHVHGLGAFPFDRVVGDAIGSVVVGAHWSRGLGVSHFFECHAEGQADFPL